MSQLEIHQEKLRKVLCTVASGTCKEEFLVLLLDKLAEKLDEDGKYSLSRVPLFQEWFTYFMSVWENSPNNPPASTIKNFTLDLLILISENEDSFNGLNNDKIYERLIQLFCLRYSEVSKEFQLKYAKLLKTLLSHKSGLRWTVTTNLWLDMYQLSLNEQPEISNEGSLFMAKFLEIIINCKENLSVEVIEMMLKPLNMETFQALKNKNIAEEPVYRNLRPTLVLHSFIFQHFLESPCLVSNLRIAAIYITKFNLKDYLNKFILIINDRIFFYELSKLLFVVEFLDFCIKAKENGKKNSVNLSLKNIIEIFKLNLLKKNVNELHVLSAHAVTFWFKITKMMPEVKSLKEISIYESEVMCLQQIIAHVPCYKVMKLSSMSLSSVETLVDSDELRSLFFNKWMKNSSECIIRLWYVFHDILPKEDCNSIYGYEVFHQASIALKNVINCRRMLSRRSAILVFQSFVYVLKDICQWYLKKEVLCVLFMTHSYYVDSVLDLLVFFIEDFSITWRESVESICVVNLTIEFLRFPKWDAETVKRALKLLNISIAKYMAPNLALLVDRMNDSSLSLLSPLLYVKCHDPSWEVRNNALEVLCTISSLADTKFTSFQKAVLETELHRLVVKILTNDSVSDVKVTALKCLYQMIKIGDLWKELNKTQNITQHMIQLYRSESENAVRKEIMTVVCCIYENRQLGNENTTIVYDFLNCAVTDPHWEVKIEALNLLDRIIKNHLQEQGMIDGSFPKVTFSKEHHKIITLTDKEISRRLQRILSKLSTLGCLGMLTLTAQDPCEDVSKKAFNIAQIFLKLLQKYNVNLNNSMDSLPVSPDSGIFLNSPSPELQTTNYSTSNCPYLNSNNNSPFSSNINSPYVTSNNSVPPTGGVANEMLDLFDELESQIVGFPKIMPEQPLLTEVTVYSRKTMTPEEFIDFFRQQSFESVNERQLRNGIDELDQVLDEILSNNEGNVMMDCF